MQKPTIYGDSISGNCYKLQLACAQLDIEQKRKGGYRALKIMEQHLSAQDFFAEGFVPMQAARPA